MTKTFCEYCGERLSEKCDCLKIIAERKAEAIKNYYNSPETHLGWSQQDTIDMYRRER